MFVTEERTDWMERGRRRATRHHQIYPVYRTPRRRRRRRRCGEAEHLVRNMWHLVEPNDHDRSGRRAGKTPSPALFTLLLSVLLVTSSSALSSSAFRTLESSHHRIARSATETGEAYGPLREKEICPSMDLRNGPESLHELSGCRVVEGFVQIVLIGQTDGKANDFSNYTYPLLREITGYLVFYRVHGLRSIGQLFPNLTVIRGQLLFFDFSLVVFELMQLQEIGLQSLTSIQRGSVFIERNPNLCYVDTIDWARIAYSGRLDLKIKDNKESCERCPIHCPSGVDGRRLCWSFDQCQKVCDKCDGGNRACRLVSHLTGGTSREQLAQQPALRQAEAECCHSECAGGCSGPHAHQCDVCRNVIHDGECRSSCPPGFYLFMKRRCVKDLECVLTPPPREVQRENRDASWKYWDDECILDCPAGYREQNVSYNDTVTYKTCVPCEGTCQKVCPAAFLNNIETVQKLRGCTAIEGSLEIQIKGGENIVKELERSLGDIVEIRGYLKIARSFPLVSLGFLRSLRNVTGVEGNEHALIVQDNQNLEKLWPKSHNITIHKKLMFHFNPQLCMGLIEDLLNASRADKSVDVSYNEMDISPWSNGDKAACEEEVLDVKVKLKTEKYMIIMWNNYRASLHDKRQLLGYIISYIEAPHQNVSYYDGRNACGGDGWVVDDVAANQKLQYKNETEFHILTRLKPYTQYAIYVQTYTVAAQDSGKRKGARSPIIYVRTLPGVPDPPEDLRSLAMSSSELYIEWGPPINPNGVITHYIVQGVWGPDNQEYADLHDYCSDQSYLIESKKNEREEAALTTSDNRTSIFGNSGLIGGENASGSGDGQDLKAANQKCECSGDSKSKETLQQKEKEQRFHIDFENFLHNKIYIRNPTVAQRAKRSVDDASVGNAIGNVASEDNSQALNEFPQSFNASQQAEAPENRTNVFYHDRLIEFTQKVTGTKYTVTGLRHYAEYTIEVFACQDPQHEESSSPHGPNPAPKQSPVCSKTALTSARTKQNDFADEIPTPVTVVELNHTANLAKITWDEPTDPNGLVIKYQIEYRRTDGANTKTKRECVRRKEYIESNRTRVLLDLAPGNYCVQVRAFSLAGPGPPTRDTCFLIEENRSSWSIANIVGVVVAVFMLILCSAGVVSFYYRRKTNGIFSNNPDYHAYVPDGWEVDRADVELVRELGKGSFGMVYEGVLHKAVSGAAEAIKCAVKTVNDRATVPERMQFLNEANVMKEFNAHHVVKLLGVVSKGQPTFVIMELMANGDLNSFLRSHRPNSDDYIEGRQPPTLKCVLKMAIEIADGMAYLADKKFVHRDLAARNCMVSEDLTVKIGDFGMTRDIYETDYYRKDGQGLLPVRWMAPESIRDGVFTSQSDVWSYGVVLWEMATLASRPYQGLANEQVLKYVMDRGVMERPEGCPDRLFNLMEMCWRYHAKQRPTFIDIIDDLLPDVPASFASVSFYHSDAGVAARAALKAQHEHDSRLLNDPTTPLRGMIADCDEIELDCVKYNDMDSAVAAIPLPVGYVKPVSKDEVVEVDEATPLRRTEEVDDEDGLEEPRGAAKLDEEAEFDADGEEDASKYGEAADDDHVAVLYPYDRRAYILVKSPTGGNSANGANGGSKSDSSKAGTTSVTSEDSKGSYVSNGSASNGYVMGILKQRRHNAEC